MWEDKKPALESYLLTTYASINMLDNTNIDLTACASAAKRAGKRFFGLKPFVCRGGSSLIRAVRHSARPGTCQPLCGNGACRADGGMGSWDPPSTSLYVLKTGKGESLTAHYALDLPHTGADRWFKRLLASLWINAKESLSTTYTHTGVTRALESSGCI
jgi:hypothetical protein